MNLTFNPEHFNRLVKAIMTGGSLHEFRVLRCKIGPGSMFVPDNWKIPGNYGGWFDDPGRLAFEARRLEGVNGYLTYNPVDPELASRKHNALTRLGKEVEGTKDKNIIRIEFLFIDIDSVRYHGEAATDEERGWCLEKRDTILADEPFGRSAVHGSSGNGGYILARVKPMENTPENVLTCREALELLADRYGRQKLDKVFVDTNTFTPSHGVPMAGTWKCKGSNSKEAPYRLVTCDGVTDGEAVDLASWVAEERPKTVMRGKPVARKTQVALPLRPAESDRDRTRKRCRELLNEIRSVSGQGGHKSALDAAFVCVKNFGMDHTEAMFMLKEWNQANADPPWSDNELAHKVEEAIRLTPAHEVGFMLNQDRQPRGGQLATRLNELLEEFDVDSVVAAGDEIVESKDLTRLYDNDDFLTSFAILEVQAVARADVLLAGFKKIPGYTVNRFKKIMAPYRLKVAAGAEFPPTEEEEEEDEDKEKPADYDLTDTGNALRLLEDFGDQIRYCPDFRSWVVYKDGKWEKDLLGRVEGAAQKVSRRVLLEMPQTKDEDTIKRYVEWARHSQSRRAIEDMKQVAQYTTLQLPDGSSFNPGVRPSAFDRDPLTVNLLNGTYDLSAKAFRPHNPSDMLMLQANSEYNPDADPAAFDRFVEQLMEGDRDMVRYLKTLLGYSITGLTDDHILMIFYGHGRNGKTTLLETVAAVLGDYASTARSTVFDQNNVGSSTSDYEIADFLGKRLMIMSEAEEGMHLSTSIVKRMTGGDGLKGRHPYERFIVFRPTHKIVLSANHKPVVDDITVSFWERLKLIPFKAYFGDKSDGTIRRMNQHLLRDKPAILNWLIEGAIDYLENGLSEPHKVQEEVRDYRDQSDIIELFLKDRTVRGEGENEQNRRLYDSYVDWCRARSIKNYMGTRTFGSKLTDKGLPAKAINGLYLRIGLRLKTASEVEMDARKNGFHDDEDIYRECKGKKEYTVRDHGLRPEDFDDPGYSV